LSLGIAFKGPEGIVLAADSRVTLSGPLPGSNLLVQSHYDNATKLLKVKDHDNVGAVTYGLGALGGRQPRTAHSYLPEFEAELATEERLSVEGFATRLGDFFRGRWSAANTPAEADALVFLVGGFDEGDAYGRVFEVSIPNAPAPVEQSVDDFGITFGGQHEIAGRLLGGYDPRLEALMSANVHLNPAQTKNLRQKVLQSLAMPIPYQFLPLQDCVDLAIFLIKTTATLQRWTTGVRGVGGAIDVATITRTDGFRAIQEKQILGDRSEL
jgi:20S proteasome alpha/beta subunit